MVDRVAMVVAGLQRFQAKMSLPAVGEKHGLAHTSGVPAWFLVNLWRISAPLVPRRLRKA